MPPRPIWIVSFLALLCAPAEAVPGRDDASRKKEGGEAWSIQLTPTQPPGARSYGASRLLGDHLPPGLSELDELPPGLRNRDELPPGLLDGIDWQAREQRNRTAVLSEPTQDRASVSVPVPEPTGLVLFSGALLLARAGVRRRQRQS